MSMGPVTGESTIDLGVGRYGLRTFKPAIVRDEPYLVSVAQHPIPDVNPRFPVKPQWREWLTDSHPISWADGTCTAVCLRRIEARVLWGGDLVQAAEYHEAPHKPCRCGIYALDDLKDLYTQYPSHTSSVVAVISASGRTIECENGIRTQHARVVAYWVLDHQNCVCGLCAMEKRVTVSAPYGRRKSWGELDGPYGGSFPFQECCETQFVNAERWDQPDEMAVHYGLKATPLTFRTTYTPTTPTVNLRVRGRRAGKVGVDLQPIIDHPPSTRGHFGFELPVCD